MYSDPGGENGWVLSDHIKQKEKAENTAQHRHSGPLAWMALKANHIPLSLYNHFSTAELTVPAGGSMHTVPSQNSSPRRFFTNAACRPQSAHNVNRVGI